MGKISEFFNDRDIFVTGGSGFLGKVLLYKLLRSCSGLKRIFVLLRTKKGKSAQERLDDIINLPIFDNLRTIDPLVLKKLIPIAGDVQHLGLGISESDFKIMKDVSIIFHSAASVRFDDPLRDAIFMNTRGTNEVCKFAESLKQFKVLIHVSTTYCNPDKKVVLEKLYEPYADWRKTIKLAEKYDTQLLNIFTAKYSGFQPNTYTFTKALAEHVVNDYRDKFTVVIFRPSIVVSALKEPLPGWIDNFNGPMGLFIASGTGLVQTILGDPDIICDYIPVDIAINAMILAAYKHGTEEFSSKLTVYNCAASSIRPVKQSQLISTAKELVWEAPLENSLWTPSGKMTRCRVNNFVKMIFTHVLVAYFMDIFFKLIKQKPFFLKLQRRIYAANLAVYYFLTNDWTFVNDDFITLDDIPNATNEIADFAFLHHKDLDLREFFYNALKGAKRFLLHESLDEVSITKSKRRLYIIYFIDLSFRIGFAALCFYIFTKSNLYKTIIS